jgi:hypothetical protein
VEQVLVGSKELFQSLFQKKERGMHGADELSLSVGRAYPEASLHAVQQKVRLPVDLP